MGKRTPLYDEHVRLGATIVPFAGWDMPVYYSAVIDEHINTRAAAGMFDTSHMGEFLFTGPGVREFLQTLLTNDMAKLEPGKALYSVMTNERGGCVDDLTVYMFSEDKYWLVVNAGTADKDFAWVSARAAGKSFKLRNISAETGMIALQGPRAKDIMAKLASDPLPERFRFAEMTVGGIKAVVSRTGYTGEDGVELYLDAADTVRMWTLLLETGAPLGLKPVGLGARDTLRLEACYSLYGHELTEDISPIEAGIGFAVAKDKTFPGSDVIQKQRAEGPARKIVAFELTERGVPREGYPVFAGDAPAGSVSSGAFSPSLKKGLGLALLKTEFAKEGQEIAVEIRGKRYAGRVVKRPHVPFAGGK